MMSLGHGCGCHPIQTASCIHIWYVQSAKAHWYAVHRHMVAALLSCTDDDNVDDDANVASGTLIGQMPAWLGQQREGNNTKDASFTTLTTQAQWWWTHQWDEGNDASARTAKMPAQWEQKSLAKQGQKCQHNNGDNASVMTAIMSERCWHFMAMLAQWWQIHQCSKENDASMALAKMLARRGQQCQRNAGKDARPTGVTRTKTPATWSHNCIFYCHFCHHHAAAEEPFFLTILLPFHHHHHLLLLFLQMVQPSSTLPSPLWSCCPPLLLALHCHHLLHIVNI